MKRFLSILFFLLLLPSFSLCEDLSSLSDDDLVLLSQSVQNEIFARGIIKSVFVPQGVYTIGIDIPEGVYSITQESGSASVEVFPNSTSDDEIYDYMLYNDEFIGKIVLSEGQRLEVLYSGITLSFYTGLKFE